jgi:hypothetical protein
MDPLTHFQEDILAELSSEELVFSCDTGGLIA